MRRTNSAAVRTRFSLQVRPGRARALVQREHDEQVQRYRVEYERSPSPSVAQNGARQHEHAALQDVQRLVGPSSFLQWDKHQRLEQQNKRQILTLPRNAWKGFIASSLRLSSACCLRAVMGSTYYLARYLLMSSERPAELEGIGSRVDGLVAVSSR